MPIFRRVRLTSRIKSKEKSMLTKKIINSFQQDINIFYKEKSMLTKKIINSFQQDINIYIHGRINNKSNTTQEHVIWTIKKY